MGEDHQGDARPQRQRGALRGGRLEQFLDHRSLVGRAGPGLDYAAIHLGSDLGTKVGTFGIAVLPDSELVDRLVNVSGYPVTPGNGELQRPFTRTASRRSRPGGSSMTSIPSAARAVRPCGPILTVRESVVVGIHAYGVGGVPANLNVVANSGPRILPEVLEVIKGWIKKATP